MTTHASQYPSSSAQWLPGVLTDGTNALDRLQLQRCGSMTYGEGKNPSASGVPFSRADGYISAHASRAPSSVLREVGSASGAA